MKRTILLFALLLAAISLVGCLYQYPPPVLNQLDLHASDLSKANKSGEACQSTFLWFIGPFGDHSIKRAADAGRISKIELVEYKRGNYIIVQQSCVVVYGN